MAGFTLPATEYCRRPADERFWTLPDLARAFHYEDAEEIELPPSRIRVAEVDGGLGVFIGDREAVRPTWHAFGQLAATAGAGNAASFLRELPPANAAADLSWGLKRYGQSVKVFRVAHECRAITSPAYSRFYHEEFANACERVRVEHGMVHPPGWATEGAPSRIATAEDCEVSTIVKPGERIGPAGVYGSTNRGTYAFMVTPRRDHVIETPNGGRMFVGTCAWNGENGERSYGRAAFGYDATCGNHNLIGLRFFEASRRRHVGKGIAQRFEDDLRAGVAAARNGVPQAQVLVRKAAVIRWKDERHDAAGSAILASILDDLSTVATRKGLKTLTRERLEVAVSAEVNARDFGSSPYGDPLTLWAIYSRLTENTRGAGYSDKRYAEDAESAVLLETLVAARS